MPSSSTVRATQSIAPSDAANMRCAVSRPYFSISRRAPSFSPVSTIPPLRELAPQPMLWASSTTTFAPLRASTRAAERPVYPAPMTATSARSGRGSGASTAGIVTPSIQNVCSLSGIILARVQGARIQAQEQAWVKGLLERVTPASQAFGAPCTTRCEESRLCHLLCAPSRRGLGRSALPFRTWSLYILLPRPRSQEGRGLKPLPSRCYGGAEESV